MRPRVRSPLWGATSQQHQRDCRADDVTMVHISAGMKGLHVHLKKVHFLRIGIQLCTNSYVQSNTIKIARIVLISYFPMATGVFLLKS